MVIFSTEDYKKLDNTLNKKTFKISGQELNDKFVKVAFDIVKFRDNDKGAHLWQIQSADDGDYIVALYDDSEDKVVTAWEVELNKKANTVHFFYKKECVASLDSKQLGLPESELNKTIEYLPEKLAENNKLVSSLLKLVGPSKRNDILSKFPELKEGK